MPARPLDALLRPRTLVVLVAIAAVCFGVSAPTKDKPGVEGAISWVAFLGSWAGLVAALVVLVGLAARRMARR